MFREYERDMNFEKFSGPDMVSGSMIGRTKYKVSLELSK
jgi:hypothetical protein